MRMLFLYAGRNSGTNEAVLQTWRKAMPSLDIAAYRLDQMDMKGAGAWIRAMPTAVRRGGLRVLWRRGGHYKMAVSRSRWLMERRSHTVEGILAREHYDFGFSIGTVTPVLKNNPPWFVYTDSAILTNRCFPDGESRIALWQECIEYERQWLQRATTVFTMSDHVSTSMVNDYHLARKQVVRVNGGCNVPASQAAISEQRDPQNILFVGVDWDRKGGPEVVEAFKRVRRQFPRATLTIVGCSPPISGEGIQVVGSVPQAQVPHYLAKAAIYCMPSKREPFGIAFLEAMRAGLPVIACVLGATPDFVIEEQTGYRVPPGDVEGLALRLEQLLSNPTQCKKMGEQGKALVAAEYTWEKTQQAMWEVVQRYL